MKTLIALALAFAPQFAAAGGAFTCKASNVMAGPHPIYIALNFSTIMNVPQYAQLAFNHATPSAPTVNLPNAQVYYWPVKSEPREFPVIAVLETTKPNNGVFQGKLTITDGRAKPYATIYDLDCKK